MASEMNEFTFTSGSGTQRATPRTRISLPDASPITKNVLSFKLEDDSRPPTKKDGNKSVLQRNLDRLRGGVKHNTEESSPERSSVSNATPPKPKFEWYSPESGKVSPFERPAVDSRMFEFDVEYEGESSEGEIWVDPKLIKPANQANQFSRPEPANQANQFSRPEPADQLNQFSRLDQLKQSDQANQPKQPMVNSSKIKEVVQRRAYPEAFDSDDENYFDEEMDNRLRYSMSRDEVDGWLYVQEQGLNHEPEDDVNVEEYWEDIKHQTIAVAHGPDSEQVEDWLERVEAGETEEDTAEVIGVFDPEALNERQYAGIISTGCLLN